MSDLITRKMDRGPRYLFGISGKICSGKTTAANALTRRGFRYTRFSEVIDDEICRRGEVPDRESRQRVGLLVHETFGQEWLCDRVLERVAGCTHVVIDGLRFKEDHVRLSEVKGARFLHLHLKASQKVRRQRFESDSSGRSFEEAMRHPVEAGVLHLEKLAHAVYENEGSVNELEAVVIQLASYNLTEDMA